MFYNIHSVAVQFLKHPPPQEELMFDEFANPPKGKGKEKDVGKRRAYVRVITNLGGGALNLELYCEKVCPIDSTAECA